jgi:hypothetical protein
VRGKPWVGAKKKRKRRKNKRAYDKCDGDRYGVVRRRTEEIQGKCCPHCLI